MAKGISIATDSEYLKAWQTFRDNFRKATPVDLNESTPDKLKRIKRLEANDEEWFKYYFPHYCTAEPADFHRKSTKKLMANPEIFIVRAWSRELAKSARGMMEDIKLAVTGKIRNKLLVSNSHKNAERLLLPYKACFESNQRIINDYGEQVRFGNWSADEFTIKNGCSFRALGWGESPRGTRNDNFRPDSITIDDIDTDEECRNEDIQRNKLAWIEQALFATRSISNPMRIVVNGNIIHDNCVVKKLGEKADVFEIINISDKDGKSTWPQKNSEADIDRVLSLISYESAQKEYFNNPMDGGDTFKELRDGKVPPLNRCAVVIYADPATSNKDKTSGSDKAIGIVAKNLSNFYIVRCAVDTMSNARFIDYMFEFYTWCKTQGADTVRVFIENNTLQNPFYEQVFLPLIYERANATGVFLPISPDERNKPEKWSRIEGTLEPINRLGHLFFNEKFADDPHMIRLKAQFRNASRKQKRLDGPDMVEGAVHKLNEMDTLFASGGFESVKTLNTKKI
jgi:hypothetical protein